MHRKKAGDYEHKSGAVWMRTGAGTHSATTGSTSHCSGTLRLSVRVRVGGIPRNSMAGPGRKVPSGEVTSWGGKRGEAMWEELGHCDEESVRDGKILRVNDRCHLEKSQQGEVDAQQQETCVFHISKRVENVCEDRMLITMGFLSTCHGCFEELCAGFAKC